MNPTDVANLPLRDIHLPAAVGWWPPAPGWWVVLTIILIAVGAWLWQFRRQFRQRAALRALRAVGASLSAGELPGDCVSRISVVMRRFAISLGGPMPVAGLTGDHWLRFLDSCWDRSAFAEGAGRLMIYGPYAPPERIAREDVETLNELCIQWVGVQKVAR